VDKRAFKAMMVKKTGRFFHFAVLVLFSFIMAVPFLWMLLTAFKTQAETTSINPFVIFPGQWRMAAFADVMRKMNFGIIYFNTLALIAGRVLCAVITAAMAGYAFGRLMFRGRNICFSLVLIQMMVPNQIFIIPQYLMINRLGMFNTIFALIFPGLVSAFGTFLMRQHFMTLPGEIEEAALIDGCSIPQIFFFVMGPLVRSGITALGIFTALFAFRDLLWPLIVNTAQNAMPISAALAKIQGAYTGQFTRYPELMAASILGCLPMIIIYILFQRRFIQGIATSGGKL
jgi:multiple sugar transport system permease protein